MFFLHTAYLWIILRTQADTRKWESIQIVRRRRNETARDKRARIEEREKENEKRTKREERAQQTKEVSTHNLGVNALEEYRCIQKCIAYTIHKYTKGQTDRLKRKYIKSPKHWKERRAVEKRKCWITVRNLSAYRQTEGFDLWIFARMRRD